MAARAKAKGGAPVEPLRDRVLSAAWIEFGDKGYAGARMDDIAKASDASKQVLYHHFVSKDGLFNAVVEKAYLQKRSLDQGLETALADLEVVDALRLFIDRLFETDPNTVRFQRIMHDENKLEAIHSREMVAVRHAYAEVIRILGELLDRGARQGKFRSGIDAAEFFVSLAGLFMFRLTNRYTLSVMLSLPLDEEAGAKASREAAVNMILGGLRPDPAIKAVGAARTPGRSVVGAGSSAKTAVPRVKARMARSER